MAILRKLWTFPAGYQWKNVVPGQGGQFQINRG
jgi:hypothetical protein